ncbi:MAG: DUF805 domain-containing protein [Pseudomonadota bacterium]
MTSMSETNEAVLGEIYQGAPKRGFGEAISVCLRNYVTFSGRASRSEYWYFFLFNILVGIGTAIFDTAVFGIENEFSPINALASLALFLPALSVLFRRLHDTDRSGWWVGALWIGMLALGLGFGALAAIDPYAADEFGGLVSVIAIAAVVYGIVILVFLCQRGTPGPNRYG